MSTAKRLQARQALNRLLDLSADQRNAELARLRQSDGEVAAEVESLLRESAMPPLDTVEHMRANDSQGMADDHTRIVGSDSPLKLPGQIGPYLVLEQIGEGGMGVVYRVRDPHFHRNLALKALKKQYQTDADMLRRFVEEAQLMGQMQHPGIPPVHDLGNLPDGRPYFVMKLIRRKKAEESKIDTHQTTQDRGQTLADLLKERSSPAQNLPALLSIFEQVCQTVAYAHNKGIIHRDLKPSNIMVGAFGEVQVMDWGLAKVLSALIAPPARKETQAEPMSTICLIRPQDSDSGTLAGTAMGTPAYMAPEQARGEVSELDERCDVFGLGAILCEILTGSPPFTARDKRDVLRSAQQGRLLEAYARLEQSSADRELVQLAQRCLAASKEDRPGNGGMVLKGITNYLAAVQELLRKKETERAAAEARAESEQRAKEAAEALVKETVARVAAERQRRRLTMVLAAAILLLGAGAGGGWVYLEHKEAAARVETERGVNLALGKVNALRDRARKMPAENAQQGELTVAVWHQCLAAVEEAEGVLAAGVPDGALRQQVAQDRQDVEAALKLADVEVDQLKKDAWLLAELDMARRLRSEIKNNRFDFRASAHHYEKTFASYGIKVAGRKPAEVAVALRQTRTKVQLPLILALDDWARYSSSKEEAVRLRECAALADDDAWRRTLRQAVKEKDVATLKRLSSEAGQQRVAAVNLFLLAMALVERDSEAGVALFRQARSLYPADFLIHFWMGHKLSIAKGHDPVRLEECIGCYRTALGIRPDSSAAHNNLGLALRDKKDLDGAIAHFKKAAEIDPNWAATYSNVGLALHDKKDLVGAIIYYKKAIQIDPNFAAPHNNLGNTLRAQNDLDGAITQLKKAIQLDPNYAEAHINLGSVLRAKQDLDGAIVHYKKAIQIDPNHASAYIGLGNTLYAKKDLEGASAQLMKGIQINPKDATAHYNLGLVLVAKKDMDGAIAHWKKTIDIDPNHVFAYNNLGIVLRDKKDTGEAIVYLKKAIQIDPNYAIAYYNLGNALRAKKDLDGAIAQYQKAIQIDPNHAGAHNNLGNTLRDKKDMGGAIEHWKKALDIEPRRTSLHGQVIAALAASKRNLEAVAAAEKARQSVAKADWLILRYDAACVYALAGCGQGDASKLQPSEQARLRTQAREWLQQEIKVWATLAEKTEPASRKIAAVKLRHCLADADFAGVREEKALAALPADERQAWQELWQDVRDLLQKAATSTSKKP